jgi:Yip1 domain
MYEQMERQASYGAYATFVTTFMIMPVVSLIIAGVLWVVFNVILGGAATFKAVLTVVTHSQVIGALGAVTAAPIQYLQGVQNMAGPFNFGALVPMLDPGSFLAMYLGIISVFVLWQLAVCGIGLAVLYARKTGGVTAGLIATYLVLGAVIAGAISSFTGGN